MLLNTTTKPDIFNTLIDQINQGLQEMTNANTRVKGYREHYLKLTDEQKSDVREYLIWLFLTAMYMRFWKGPGNNYPEVWVEGGGGDERCEMGVRTKNVNDQFTIRTQLLESMDNDLEAWVLSFPRIEYNFKEGTSSVGAEPINFIVEEAQMGNFCLAEASDHLVQTSYYLLTQLTNSKLDGFNNEVNDYLGNPGHRNFNPLAVTGTRHIDPQHRLEKLD